MSVTRRLAAAGAGISAAALLLLGTAPAHAAGVGYTTTTDRVPAAAGWVATQFVNGTHLPAIDGDHFDSKYGSSYYPNYGENADVIFGLAAAKSSRSKIDVALTYLADHVDAYADISNADGYGPSDGAVAKLAVAAQVAGADPTAFGGYDLLARLATDECAAGSTSCTPGSAANIYSSTSESFVILAQARAGGSHAPSAAATAFFLSLQCANGGFTTNPTACGSGAADLDSTSYAIMALGALGGHQTELTSAVAWLRSQQKSGGYWVDQDIPNTNTTGLAAAALQHAGADVSSARTWLRAQQVAAGAAGAGAMKYDGSVKPTTTSATSPSVLATAQALTGLVDGGSLAVLTAQGAGDDVTLYPPAATLSATTAKAGSAQTVSAHGFVPGEKVQVSLHSAPVTVATVTAGPLGAVAARYTLPASTSAGAHTVVLTGLTSSLSTSDPLTVTAAASSTAPTTGAASGSASDPASPTGGQQTLAATGQDRSQVDRIAVFGALAVVIGGAVLFLGRRRPVSALRAVTGRHRADR